MAGRASTARGRTPQIGCIKSQLEARRFVGLLEPSLAVRKGTPEISDARLCTVSMREPASWDETSRTMKPVSEIAPHSAVDVSPAMQKGAQALSFPRLLRAAERSLPESLSGLS
jgi:hypothetical protein